MSDVSKRTVAVLLVVALVLSAISAWKLISSGNQVEVKNVGQSSGTAQVFVGIGNQNAPTPKAPVSKTGQVSVGIQ